MTEVELAMADNIKERIYTIRGRQVMLDRDLAELYGVRSTRLREQVKRNSKRFPAEFMFQLTEDEVNIMVSQNAIPSKQHLGGYLPYTFTEQGVAMLASVLKSENAIKTSIQIINTFVNMRKFIVSNNMVFQRLDHIEYKQFQHKLETDERFNRLFNALESKELSPKQGIFFEGQIYDAYEFLSNIFRSAKQEITIIDNYIDDSVITHLKKIKKGVKAMILTKNITRELELDIKKYNQQYPEIELKHFPHSHDRFIIIDNTDIYHFGASLKDLGKKIFAFSRFDKEGVDILKRLSSAK